MTRHFFLTYTDIYCAGIRLIVANSRGTLATTDAQQAMALGHKRDDIHIYSNSWGPSDSGFGVAGPGSLLKQTLMEGAQAVSNLSLTFILMHL